MSVKAPVNRIIPFSSVDGPGNRTAIFLQGCSFECCYCHNPETIHTCVHCGACVDGCPTGALSLCGGKVVYAHEKCVQCDQCIKVCPNLSSPRIRMVTAGDAMKEVRRNVPFVRGITVSGGECTLHREFLVELAAMARAEGMSILLDSNGGYDFSEDLELTDAVDGVMLDVKAWNNGEHRRIAGVDNASVIRNLRFLAEHGKLTEVRTVNVPDLMNAQETVRGVCSLLKEVGSSDTRYKLIRFRPMGVREQYRGMRSPSEEEMRALERIAHEMGVFSTVLI